MKTTVSSKGQILLPAEIRHLDKIQLGQEFDIERIDEGQYLLRRKKTRRNSGLIKVLLDCPVKGWFEPFRRDETTDQILTPKFE